MSLKKAAAAGAMLVELTQVTRDNLKDVAGPLWAIWATAQQINARQKVELSIRCVFSGSTINTSKIGIMTQTRFISEGLKSKFESYYPNL